MTSVALPRLQRWISYAACVWAVLFAAPHTWWALGITAGFPGGDRSYNLFMASTWRIAFNLTVIVLSGLTIVITLRLLRPPEQVRRRWIPRTAAWIACGMLTLRGVAGMIVDGTEDLVWWPAFLAGGLLLGGVAWTAGTRQVGGGQAAAEGLS
jgi:hypothetical protein